MESLVARDDDLNLKATELRLGLPGSDESEKDQSVSSCVKNNNKRSLNELAEESAKKGLDVESKHGCHREAAPTTKAQIVGWPPVRSYRRNSFQQKAETDQTGFFVKVSVDGAPYLRKIDLKGYKGYADLLKALEIMFKLTIGKYSEREGYKGSEYAPAYEDKDGDLMLVGDVPWDMFLSSCKKLRIMKGSDAKGLGVGA